MTLTKKAAPINLDALAAEVAGTVELFGRVHDVLQMDGDAYRMLLRIQSGDLDMVENWTLAARLVPTLSAEDVGKLKPKQVGGILAIAGGNIGAVEAMLAEQAKETADPNGAGPAADCPPA